MMQHEARIGIRQMDITETFLMDSKELLKAHNKVCYTARKEEWDEYQINRNERGIDYCERRLGSIRRYQNSLVHEISIFDIIFRTAAWEEYCAEARELRKLEDELWKEYLEKRAALKKAKADLKIHKKEAKEAAREEKKLLREQKKKDRGGPDERRKNTPSRS